MSGKVTVQRHPNGSTTYFSYDGAGRLSDKVTKKDADGSVLVKFAYTRDAEGNPIAIERESGLGVYYYEYDIRQRLAYEGQFIAAARQYENYYEYDGVGNRTLLRHGETAAENLTYYDHNAANELTQLHDKDGWTYFAYDANGNATEEQTPSYTRYYDWDGRGLLTGVRSTEGGWTDNEIRYDGMGSRAMTVESTGLTYYDWDGLRVLQEKDGSGAVTDRQVHGYAPVVSVGDIAHMDKSGAVYVPTADQVGTIWHLLDSSAAKANAYTYDAFGVGRSASEGVSNQYRFATKRSSLDVGLYHFVNRTYMPRLSTFTQRDPVADVSSMRSYPYVAAKPLKYVDPAGYKICAPVAGSLRALMVFAAQINTRFTRSRKPDKRKRMTWQLLSCIACQESSYDPCAIGDTPDYGLMQLTPVAIAQCHDLGVIAFPSRSDITVDDRDECCPWASQPRFSLHAEEDGEFGLVEARCPPRCEESVWNIRNQVFCAARFLRYLRDSEPPEVTVTLAMLICRYNKGAGHPKCRDDNTSRGDDFYVKPVLECLKNLGEEHEPGDPDVVWPPEESI